MPHIQKALLKRIKKSKSKTLPIKQHLKSPDRKKKIRALERLKRIREGSLLFRSRDRGR